MVFSKWCSCNGKAQSWSHHHSEIILISWFVAQKTFINVEITIVLPCFCLNHNTFTGVFEES